MSDIPTVKVKHEDGYMIINQSDFDSSKHQLYQEASESAETASEAESKESPKPWKRK